MDVDERYALPPPRSAPVTGPGTAPQAQQPGPAAEAHERIVNVSAPTPTTRPEPPTLELQHLTLTPTTAEFPIRWRLVLSTDQYADGACIGLRLAGERRRGSVRRRTTHRRVLVYQHIYTQLQRTDAAVDRRNGVSTRKCGALRDGGKPAILSAHRGASSSADISDCRAAATLSR